MEVKKRIFNSVRMYTSPMLRKLIFSRLCFDKKTTVTCENFFSSESIKGKTIEIQETLLNRGKMKNKMCNLQKI